MRYKTTHTRAFHKCLNDLLKLRAEKRKAEFGFEAQKVESERHEMRKQSHYWEILKKDAEAMAILQSGKPYDASLRGTSMSTVTKAAVQSNNKCKNRKHRP